MSALMPTGSTMHAGRQALTTCQRVNFRGMWGLEGIHRDTSMYEIPGSRLSVGGLESVKSGASLSRNAIRFAAFEALADCRLSASHMDDSMAVCAHA
jgi:hypothetical protein